MALDKNFQDIVEIQNIRFPAFIPSDYEKTTADPNTGSPISIVNFSAALVDFKYLGIKYKASDLYGCGIETSCLANVPFCRIVFANQSVIQKPYAATWGSAFVFTLPISDTFIKTGENLCAYIVNELCKNEYGYKNFLSNYQQYAYRGSELYVYDNRNLTLSSFAMGVYNVPVALRATYYGPSIKVGEQYDINDVEVEIIWIDDDVSTLPANQWEVSSLVVSALGPNVFTVYCTTGLDFTAEFIVNGLGVSGLRAEYIGPPIPIQECYDIHNVKVELAFSDNTFKSIDCDKLLWEKNLRINDNGLLRKFVSYTDESGDTYTADYFVPGVPRPFILKARYLSVKKAEGSKIQKNELKVSVIYLLNDFDIDHRQTEERFLQPDDWTFLDTDIINSDNDGTLMIKWETDISFMHFCFIASVQIHFIDITEAYLAVWYEGPSIEVGDSYSLDDLVIYLCEPNKDKIPLHYYDPSVIINMDTTVTHEGDNKYEISYRYEGWLLKATYYVPGIISKIYPNIDFKVVYIVKDTFEEIDLTEDFRPYFTYINGLVISWNQFMLRIRDYELQGKPYFGMFRVDAPKRTGLWNKYASSWHVYVYNTRDLIAEIYKVYCDPIKEVNPDGEIQENTSQ